MPAVPPEVFDKGTYQCAACGTPLYTSEMKFDCGCGWPGFWTNIDGAVRAVPDADGMRVEIVCPRGRASAKGSGGEIGIWISVRNRTILTGFLSGHVQVRTKEEKERTLWLSRQKGLTQ